MNRSQQRFWKPSTMITKTVVKDKTAIEALIMPETALEKRIISDSNWQEGAFWGEPRPGHPEGKIIFHIHEVLENVNKVTKNPVLREQLRLVTIIHDTFKHVEEQARPRTDWSKHHAIYALNFAKKHLSDKAVLDVIELHDEAFYAWRDYRAGRLEASERRLNNLRTRLKGNLRLFYLFFKCDTQTGDKYQAPIQWFESRIAQIDASFF